MESASRDEPKLTANCGTLGQSKFLPKDQSKRLLTRNLLHKCRMFDKGLDGKSQACCIGEISDELKKINQK